MVMQKSNQNVYYCGVLLQERAIFHFPEEIKVRTPNSSSNISDNFHTAVSGIVSEFCGLYQEV